MRGDSTFYWQPFDKGFYIALTENKNYIGLASSMIYLKEEKEFQMVLQLGTIALAIGWEF